MAVAEIIHTVLHAALDAPDLGFQQAFGLFAVLSRLDGVHEIAVNRGHVIAVCHVIGLHLPVMVAHIGLRSPDHFQPVGRLVGEQVDKEFRLAEMDFERRHGIGQRAEDKTAIFTKLGDFGEVVMRPVEIVAIAAFLVLDADAFAGAFIAPAVEPAGDGFRVALLERRDDGAAMRTRIDEGFERAVLLAVDENRLAADMGGVIVAGVRHLAFMAQEIPQVFEAEFHLGVENTRVLEDRPVQPEFMVGLRPVVHPVGEIDNGSLIGHGGVPRVTLVGNNSLDDTTARIAVIPRPSSVRSFPSFIKKVSPRTCSGVQSDSRQNPPEDSGSRLRL